ncbi:MAG: DUF998 domain-containing protein [Candidatus Dadabacteria bacterium]
MEPTITQPKNELLVQGSTHKLLLVCGILSSLLYVAMNLVAALLYPGYNALSQAVSELSAVDAPTRSIWLPLGFFYSFLVIAFGAGVWQSGVAMKPLKTIGLILMISGFVGLFWPPMHQREVLAAGGGTLTDSLHIAFTMIIIPLMMAVMVISATLFGKNFRIYTIVSLVVLVGSGVLTGLEAPHMQANEPTPLMGLWERINIAAYMLWVIVFTMQLFRKEEKELLETEKRKGEVKIIGQKKTSIGPLHHGEN